MAESNSRKTILLVEDEAIIAMSEARLLEKHEYEVITVYNAEEAIETARETRVDLILMDIDLGYGKMDGTEAAEVILKERDLPIVFCTSHAEKEYVDKVRGITRYGYVLKNSGEFVLKQSVDTAFELFSAHRNLKNANNEWNNTFNSIKDVVTIISKDHTIIKINDAGCTSAGLRRGEILGKKCYEVIHNIDSPLPGCSCTSALERHTPSSMEHNENGRFFDLAAWPMYDEDKNEIRSFVHIVKDITERKRAQQAEKKSRKYESRYRMLFNSIRDAIIVTDTERNIIDCNQAFTDQVGFALNELQDKKTLHLYANEEEYREMGDALDRHKGDLSDFLYTIHYKKKDGTVFPGETNVFYLHDDEGNTTGFIGLIRDVGDRLRSERQLKASERSLRITLESIGDAVISTDREGKVVRMNPVAQRLCGWKRQDALGKKLEEVFHIVNADTRERVDNPVGMVIQTGEIVGLANHTMLISRAGNEYQIADSAAPIKGDDGEINGVVLIFRDVTKEYETAQRLKESRYFLAESQRIAHLGSWSLDLAENRLYWSDEVYRIFGLEPQEFSATYEAFLEAVHPEDRSTVDAAYLDSVDEGRDGYEIEHRVVHKKTGQIHWVREKCYHTRNAEGSITRSVGMVQDITEHKQAEAALRTSEERYRKAQAVARVGSWEYHIVTDSFWGSEEGKRIYGFDPDTDDFSSEEVMKHVIERERVDRALIDLIEKDIPYDIEFEIVPRGSDEIRTIRSVAELERDEEGNPVTVTGILHDITLRKQAERALKKSEEKYRRLFNYSNDAIFVHSIEEGNIPGKNIEVNEQACRLLQYGREELLNMSVREVTPESKYAQLNLHSRELREKRHLTFEAENIRKDGTAVPVEVSAYLHEEGNESIVVSTVRDITLRKRTERALREALEEKDYLMKELSHRTRNNLSMVSALISLKEEEIAEDLSDLKHRIEAIGLVHEKLYRSDEINKIRVKEYLQELLEAVFSSFTLQKVEIINTIKEVSIHTKTAVPLGLAVNEIAVNAIKYGFKVGEEARFTVGLTEDTSGEQYVLTLSNTGNPFPEEIDLDNPTTFGLQLVSALVEQLEGTIELKRSPVPVFTIHFPVPKTEH